MKYKNSRHQDICVSIILGSFLTALSYVTAALFHWIDHVDWLEAFAVFTSYSCTYLCVKQRRVNYIIGALSTLAFSLLFYRADLLASALLNLYLTPQLLYGWIRWNRDEITRPVTNVTWKSVPAYLVVTGLFWFGAYNLVKLFDGQMAGWDTAILIGSILAQFLLDNKKLQTWIVWAVVNVIAIILYAKNGLQITAFQYVFFLANTIYGYISWKETTSVTHLGAYDVLAAN